MVSTAVAGSPAPAVAKSFEDAAKELTNFNATNPVLKKPDNVGGNWKAIVEPFGIVGASYDGKTDLGTEPMVASFIVPDSWITQTPLTNVNGTSGTIGANEYFKGDSVTLYVANNWDKAKANGTPMEATMKNRAPMETVLLKALSQKGKSFIDNFKVSKVYDNKDSPGYKLAKFQWTITSGTGAGVDRFGLASITQAGKPNAYQVLWAAVVLPRYNDMEEKLEAIVKSFRVSPVAKKQLLQLGLIKEQEEEYSLEAPQGFALQSKPQDA